MVADKEKSGQEILMQITEVIPFFVIFRAIALVIKWIIDYRLKIKLINMGMVDEKVKFLNFDKPVKKPLGSLKWGIVITFIGLASLVMSVYPDDLGEGFVFGVIFIAAGLGLLIYYFIEGNLEKKAKQEAESRPQQ